MRTLIERFIERCAAIGINIELHGNFPWVYLHKINGKLVTGTFRAEHGWTAFFMTGDMKFSDRRAVFEKIRNHLTEI